MKANRLFAATAAAVVVLTVTAISVTAGPTDPPSGAVAATGPTMIFTLPYTISTPGSYRLGRSLTAVGPSFGGITVNASDVTIDFDGQFMNGVSTVQGGNAVSCAAAVSNVALINGTLFNWQRVVSCTGRIRLERLRVRNCGESALQPYAIITGGANCEVLDCTFVDNAQRIATLGTGAVMSRCANNHFGEGTYMSVGDRSLVTDCAIADGALVTGNGCTVSRCSVIPSFGPALPNTAIATGSGCTVADCTVNTTGTGLLSGITTGSDSNITGCTVVGGNTSIFPVAISAGSGSSIRDCKVTVTGTGSIGIIAPPTGEVRGCVVTAAGTCISATGNGATIDANTVTGASVGIGVSGASNLVVRNTARGNTADYSIGAGNAFGPIINATAGGDLSVIAGANHPQANFRY